MANSLFSSTHNNLQAYLGRLSGDTEEVEKEVLALERRLKECEGAIEMCKELEKRLTDQMGPPPPTNYYTKMMQASQSQPVQTAVQTNPPPQPVQTNSPPQPAQTNPPENTKFIDVPEGVGPGYLPRIRQVMPTIPEEPMTEGRSSGPSSSSGSNPYKSLQTAEELYVKQSSQVPPQSGQTLTNLYLNPGGQT